MKPNNEQIDNTSYYKLPCGRYLEDFIHEKCLNFAAGSALKYLWRAGKKDGESTSKDMDKCMHYCKFIARRHDCSINEVFNEIKLSYDKAMTWGFTKEQIVNIQGNLMQMKGDK